MWPFEVSNRAERDLTRLPVDEKRRIVAAVGIADLGDPTLRSDELPVFWACGGNLQAVVMANRPPFVVHPRAGAYVHHGRRQRPLLRVLTCRRTGGEEKIQALLAV
jgi:hypothetical protein